MAPDLAKRGIKLYRYLEPEMTYYYFNMVDPDVGGFSKERIALRRAIAMSYNIEDEIRVIRKSQAIKAESPIPPGVVGEARPAGQPAAPATGPARVSRGLPTAKPRAAHSG